MKILLISNGYPPQRWAGTETYTAGMAEELGRRGHTVQVLCAGKWDSGPANLNGYEDATINSVQVRQLWLNWQKNPDPFGYLYNNPVVAQYFADYLRELRPDVVHVTSCETLSASVLPVVKAAGLPLVLSLTDFWFICPRMTLYRSDGTNCSGVTTPEECLHCQMAGSTVQRWSERVLPEGARSKVLTAISQVPALTRQRGLRGWAGDMRARKRFLSQAITWPDVRITASAFVREVFIANQVSASIRLQAYGHDLSWLSGHEAKAPSPMLCVGYIGQIIPAKGVHLLLEAFIELSARYPDRVSLLIYGNMEHSPAYRDQLLQLANGRPNICFGGTFAHEAMGSVLSGMDVLAVPSLWYDFPLIIHEALATQTPVIASNLGGMAESILSDVNGLLFEKGEAGDLARKLQRLLDEPDLLGRLRAGIAPVKTIAQSVTELEQIYAELTPSRESPPQW